ncbi:MAG: hypothetical protein IIZ35_03495 [Clostridia bacterium]|nr:hypothetical protein [Clostridia bacterium]
MIEDDSFVFFQNLRLSLLVQHAIIINHIECFTLLGNTIKNRMKVFVDVIKLIVDMLSIA